MSILDPDTIYRIEVKQSEKVIAVEGAAVRSDGRIVQWDWRGGNEQRFRVFHLGADIYIFMPLHSGRVITVPGGDTGSGVKVIQSTLIGAPYQQFSVLPAGGEFTFRSPSFVSTSPGPRVEYFYISPIHSGKRLAIRGDKITDNGAELIQWDATEGGEQKFRFLPS